ncbi:apoptosis antagonizing transcription factor-domain-containing protein [Trametes gibbosa]|nr:apoptosis antagonizing transcription factor-domain-containing protein [Trametes gibbosa]
MSARISLKDQLAELAQPAPVDLDPEDALAGFAQHRLLPIDEHAAREHYTDVAPSAIRKLHESVNDPKYDGIRTSRKQLLLHLSDHDSDPDQDEDGLQRSLSEGNSEEDEEFANPAEDDDASQDASGSASEADQDKDEAPPRTAAKRHSIPASPIHSAPASPPAASPEPQREDSDIASNLRKTHEVDKKKGRAVSRQIALWDTLLDARIQLHKAVTAANRLPSPSEIAQYVVHPSAREAINSFVDVADSLTEQLFSLQEDLLRLNESIEPPARKRRRLSQPTDASVPEHSADLAALSSSASALEASCHPWLVDTLSKWSAKVQAVAPNLLDRTRKRKDRHARIGQTLPSPDAEDTADADLFDDTDYYQQLLRDIIAARGGTAGDAASDAQWQAAQRDRKARRKRTVDTKASKGRKLRYDAHAKLQNFMVPVPVVVGEWHEAQIDGLFSSLLQS